MNAVPETYTNLPSSIVSVKCLKDGNIVVLLNGIALVTVIGGNTLKFNGVAGSGVIAAGILPNVKFNNV